MTASAGLVATEVKAGADFVAIASCYTSLRRSGRQYVGLCPLHRERHPSFFVHPDKKIFYCFGCNAGGDLFDFVMQVENIAFSSALAWVADFPCRHGGFWGRRRRPAVFAGRSRQGAKPPLAAKQPTHIVGKPEAPRSVGPGISPSVQACAAEAAFFT
jgi:hypothetical protein